MYEGNPVDLQMEKVISADAIFDDTTRVCKVDHYDTEEDYMYLEVMEEMIVFSSGMLDAVAQFLGSEPIIYLFGLVCLCFVVRVFKDIIN